MNKAELGDKLYKMIRETEFASNTTQEVVYVCVDLVMPLLIAARADGIAAARVAVNKLYLSRSRGKHTSSVERGIKNGFTSSLDAIDALTTAEGDTKAERPLSSDTLGGSVMSEEVTQLVTNTAIQSLLEARDAMRGIDIAPNAEAEGAVLALVKCAADAHSTLALEFGDDDEDVMALKAALARFVVETDE